jgi:chemotaxis protein CheZ
MGESSSSDGRLEQARALVVHLEAGETDQANQLLSEMAGCNECHDTELFQEVGRLTRELHEAINGFLLDERIADMAERAIPDASERLSYVIKMTEESANTTLGAVESALPLANELGEKSRELSEEWERFRGRKLSVEDFRILSSDLTEFLNIATDHSRQLHDKLSEVLMAQGFQDLTGQIIRQVIDLVHDLEGKLVQLVKISGAKLPETSKKEDASKLEGPVIPTIDQGEVLKGQDDVDDLLSSLGF